MGLLRLAHATPEVAPDVPVAAAVRVMVESKVGALLVTEGGRLLGVLSERDLMRRVVFDGKDPATTPVREAMTSPVRTVSDGTSVAEAVAIMRAAHIRHLVILDGAGQIAGVVGLRYLLYDLMDGLERKVDDLQGYLMADSPGG